MLPVDPILRQLNPGLLKGSMLIISLPSNTRVSVLILLLRIFLLWFVCFLHIASNWDSTIRVMTRLWAGQLRNCSIPGWGKRFFIFSKACTLAVRLTHPASQWISTAFSVVVKWLVYEAVAIPLAFIGTASPERFFLVYLCMLLHILNFFTHQIMKLRDSKFLQHYCWKLEAPGHTGLLDWKWRHHCPLKHWEPPAYWHSGVSQMTGVFKWWRWFCNFHQTPVISCLLGPNILLIHLCVTVSVLSGQGTKFIIHLK